MLNKGEEIHDLPAPGYRLIQDRAHFRYGTDAVLLADFCRRDKSAPAADLGAGTGALSILLLAGAKAARVDAVELQPRLCDMARRSAQLNGLSARMAVYEADLAPSGRRPRSRDVRQRGLQPALPCRGRGQD